MKIPTPRKLPSGKWFIQLRLNGASIPVTAGTAKECEREAALIKAEHLAGKRAITSEAETLADAMRLYVAAKNNVLSPSTIRGYKIIMENRFEAVRNKKLSSVNWQAAVNVEAGTCSAKTLKNAWGFAAAALKFVGVNVPKVSLPQVVVNARLWLTPEEIKVFVSAVKDKPFAIAALLGLHGLRRSEIFALTWEQIDLKRGVIQVRGAVVQDENHKFIRKQTNKNTSSARTVPIMIPELTQLLNSCEKRKGVVCSGSPNTLSSQIKKLCQRNNLPEITAHGLRHSFASLAHSVGMPELDCMRLGGWSDFTTMKKIYTHISEKDTEKYKNKITDFFTEKGTA